MRTGRPRGFCVDEVLDRAMTVFWRHGYKDASVAELTAAMGINAPSMYACFGDKEGLFRAVLERYDARREAFMAQILSASDARAVAAAFLHGVADFAAGTAGRPAGCLLLQGGLSSADARIPEILARHRAEKEAALCARFERAKQSGDLPHEADPAALARYLSVIANGICVQASSGAAAEELHQVAALALAGWPGAGPAHPATARRALDPISVA